MGGQCFISLAAKYIMTAIGKPVLKETKSLSQINRVFLSLYVIVLPGEGLLSEHFN